MIAYSSSQVTTTSSGIEHRSSGYPAATQL